MAEKESPAKCILPWEAVARVPNLPALLGPPDAVRLAAGRTDPAIEAVLIAGAQPAAARFAAARGLRLLELLPAPYATYEPPAPDRLLLGAALRDAGAERPALRLLAGDWTPDAALLDRARHGIALVRRLGLSQENHRAPRPGATGIVAVEDDALAELARRTHPDAEIVGADAFARSDAVTLLSRAAHFYGTGGRAALDALILGVPVTCAGGDLAGWGLTREIGPAPAGRKPRTLEEVFAAFCQCEPRYVDPYSGTACEFETAIEALATLRDRSRRFARPIVFVHFGRWKRAVAAAMVGRAAAPRSFVRGERAALREAARRGAAVAVWASKLKPAFARSCAEAGLELIRVEDGFIRSRGLGAAFVQAGSLVFDSHGIYYDPAGACDLERILQRGGFDAALLARAAALRESVVARGITKYAAGAGAADADWPRDRRRILVPGQVADDASIRHGTRGIADNLALLEAVRKAAPDAFIVYKTHPDVAAGYRPGAVPAADIARLADRDLAQAPAAALLGAVDEVHTMSSLMGFEALMRGVKVVTYGLPFYAGWGLTVDRLPPPRPRRRATLDELVAAALIEYPLYLDPVSRLPCGPELLIRRLAEDDARAGEFWRPTRFKRLYRRATTAWRRSGFARR